MANFTIAGAIPFYEVVNAAILLLNGGFLLSQLGQEVKIFLMLASNQHYEHLGTCRKPEDYVRLSIPCCDIVMSNFLFLSVSSIMVAFGYYPLAHLVTIGWYGCTCALI
jgi:hypothetical protein